MNSFKEQIEAVKQADTERTVERISNRLKESINKGYTGVVISDFIMPEVGEELKKLGLSYKTYTDGIEFSESSIWVDLN